jgi:hypothetical protein
MNLSKTFSPPRKLAAPFYAIACNSTEELRYQIESSQVESRYS